MAQPTSQVHQSEENQGVRRIIPIAIVFATVLGFTSPAAFAQSPDDGAEVYTQKCARCHQDDGLGVPNKYPPLAGNPDAADFDHVVDVVTNGLEGKVILGVTYERKMPSFGDRLTPQEIQDVAAYTVQLSESGPSTSPSTTAPPTQGSAAAGDDLFTGAVPLTNGGTACIACHAAGDYDRLGGPGLAISLNGIVEEYTKSGFVSAITDPVVDPMIAVFGNHPITDQEANDLAAFLEPTTADTAGSSPMDLLLVLGIAGFLLLILITALVIRGPQNTYVTKLRSTR